MPSRPNDPHATAIVYRHSVPVHRSIGLDVTCQVVMDANEVRRRFQSKLLRPVLDFAEVWFQKRNAVTFHDPLAATTIFDDQICGVERGTVEVELLSKRLKGMTHWTPEPSGKHDVALSVDAERFFNHFFAQRFG